MEKLFTSYKGHAHYVGVERSFNLTFHHKTLIKSKVKSKYISNLLKKFNH